MILVDTSAWVDHLRVADGQLTALLLEDAVCCHAFVVGELSCGTLKHRTKVLGLLKNLRQAPMVDHEEALGFVETHGLIGSGLGWIDVHLLASTVLAGNRLWTKDRRLDQAARRLGVAA